ncbi:cupin domain-containing [Lecanosticta acicola]|uniref:Cupin domain-containing n=1 Tax=Lecanosticta acicola TaxID=111012 RepID=A0AAI9EE18_9PEZI|nr:cupin domain-containing [Lecanosticta acicola]
MASELLLTPLQELKVLQHQIPAHGLLIPNTSLQRKPLLIYKAAFHTPPPPPQNPTTTTTTTTTSSSIASAIETHLSRIGIVVPQWRFTMYSTSHFHSTTHEVLAVCHGRARLCFGHEENPGRVESVLERGDVIVIPAGVSHRLLEDLDGGFEMVGSYPEGSGCRRWDMCYGRPGEEGQIAGIRGLGWFERDPVYGDEGPVLGV